MLDNMIEESQEGVEFDPDDQFDKSPESIERLTQLGCDTLWRLWDKDQPSTG